MASRLHEAVRLAQEGRRDDARSMLRQVIQQDPNNEMAWLWLASVAADQAEYERALTEVLRVNPTNEQARRLLDQFHQQYGSRLSAAPPLQMSPQTPPPYGAPTGQPSYGGQPVQQQPPAYYGPPSQPPQSGPVSGYAPYGAPAAPERIIERERVVKRRRGGCLGCGCVPSCLLFFLVFIVLPAVACGALAYTVRDANLGPGDWLAAYLPDDAGHKDVEFQVEDQTVSISVPRSWYLATEGNDWWNGYADVMDTVLKFEDPDTTWADVAVDLAGVTPSNANVPIVETNPARLLIGGMPSMVQFTGLTSASDAGVSSFECTAVRGAEQQLIQPFAAEGTVSFADFASGTLCGYRIDVVSPVPGGRIFELVDAPDEAHTTIFFVPTDSTSATAWIVITPENQYDGLADDIERMTETATVETSGASG